MNTINMKQLRIANKISQTDIAKIIGTSQANYGKMENGDIEANVEKLIKLADYYQVSLDYLVGRDFGNKLGYLSEEEIAFVQTYLKLTESHKNKLLTYALTLLASQ